MNIYTGNLSEKEWDDLWDNNEKVVSMDPPFQIYVHRHRGKVKNASVTVYKLTEFIIKGTLKDGTLIEFDRFTGIQRAYKYSKNQRYDPWRLARITLETLNPTLKKLREEHV